MIAVLYVIIAGICTGRALTIAPTKGVNPEQAEGIVMCVIAGLLWPVWVVLSAAILLKRAVQG